MKTYKIQHQRIGAKVPFVVTKVDDEKAENDYGMLEDTLLFELAMKGIAPLKIQRCLLASLSEGTTQIALKCQSVYIGRSRAMRLYKAKIVLEVENLPSDHLTAKQVSEIYDMQKVPTNR